jgi:hypothetical protein
VEFVLAIRHSWGAEPSGRLVAVGYVGDHQVITPPGRSAPRR